MTALSPRRWPDWTRPLLRAFALGAVCGVAGYVFGRWALPGVLPHDAVSGLALRWSDVLAALTAVAMLIGMAVVLVNSLDPDRLGRMYRLEGPASDGEIAQARLQSVVMGFSAVILVLPLIFSLTGVDPVLALALIAPLLGVHTVLNARVYREADELLRRIVLESATATFFLGQGLLFLWAAAERLGAVPPIAAWDVYALLMTLYLAVSVVVTARRGLA